MKNSNRIQEGMGKKTIRKPLVVVLVAWLGLVSVFIYSVRNSSEPTPKPAETTVSSEPFNEDDYIVSEGKMTDFLKLSDKLLLVDGLHYWVTGRYLINLDGQIAYESFVKGVYGENDKLTLRYYNIEQDMASEKEVDFLAVLTAYNPNFLFSFSTYPYRHLVTGDHYLQFHYIDVRERPEIPTIKEIERLEKVLYYNLDTGEIEESPENLEEISQSFYFGAMFGFDETDIYDYAYDQNSNISISSNRIFLLKSKEGDKLQNIYKEYGLTKEQMSGGYAVHWFGEPNSRELAYLLAPEGQDDVLKGVTLRGAYSKDGQDHVLEGYDDFFKWYQAPEEEKEE